MIDRWRIAWHRPLSERGRRLGFIVAVLVILVASAGLLLIEDPRRQAPTTDRPRADQRRPADSPTAAVTEPVRPSEEGRASAAVIDSPAQVRAPRRAARRFLSGYLPYTYGRRAAASIPATSKALRRDLAARRPRAGAGARRRRARVVLIHGEGVGERRAGMLALVRDRARRYTVSLELALGRSGWRVVAVGS